VHDNSFPLFFLRNGFLSTSSAAYHPVRNYNQCNHFPQSFLVSKVTGNISKQLSGIALTWPIAGLSPIVVL
jgi:hypothetical protein